MAIVLLRATACNRGMYSGIRLRGSAVLIRLLQAASLLIAVAWPAGLILKMLLNVDRLRRRLDGVCVWNRPDADPCR